MHPSVSFKTVGCRLNRAQTARMAAQFEDAGYRVVPHGDPCDVVVIHSCTVTQQAEKKSIRFARAAKRSNEHPTVILAGCAAEVNGDHVARESGADMVIGQKDKFDIPDMLPNRRNATQRQHSCTPRFDTSRAWVQVQDGCDFNCAYCIVPAARGTPVSRQAAEIIDEVSRLTAAGHAEIVLTGANIGCYRDNDGTTLSQLLDKLEALDDLKRMRLSSIELSTSERELVEFMSTSAKLCRFMHVPLQSGSDRILRSMGRHYSAAEYADFVKCACDRIGPIGLGTDLIMGLPGELAQDAQATVDLVRQLPFSNLHVFPYSPRPDTRAMNMPGQVDEKTKRSRVRELMDIGEEKRRAFAQTFVGREVSVLVEDLTSCGAGKGWTDEYLNARVNSPDIRVNTIVTAKVSAADGCLLICDTPPSADSRAQMSL